MKYDNTENLEYLNVKQPLDESDEDEVLDVEFNDNTKTLAELLYDCYLNNNFDVNIINKNNPDFVLYFVDGIVYVKNFKDKSGTDMCLMEIQCIWLALQIQEVNYFRYETLGYEIIK